ncbi:MAG: two-component system response regulator RpfG [Gammaproteobacteria bacterium]|jgi:two-component system response regulator RpfG
MTSSIKTSELQSTKSTIFIVDDQATSRMILENIAKTIDEDIEVKSFDNASDALLEIESSIPDLILTDYKMPDIDGVEFIKRLRNDINCKDIPVVIITALNDKNALYKALEAGATDFLVKPVDHYECKVRCHNLLTMQKQQMIIKNHASSLEIKIKEATKQIHFRELETLARLARAGEFKGKITGRNLIRMGKITSLIAEGLGFDEGSREILEISSTMHDIGKIGIPDSILLKPGPLEKEEFEVMKGHPHIGYEILKNSPSPYLQMGAIIALHHHEKYDGSGYPDGLKGDEISMEARIATVADVFDALITKRPYKEAWPVETAYDYIKNDSGKHFDPQCVDALFAQKDRISECL